METLPYHILNHSSPQQLYPNFLQTSNSASCHESQPRRFVRASVCLWPLRMLIDRKNIFHLCFKCWPDLPHKLSVSFHSRVSSCTKGLLERRKCESSKLENSVPQSEILSYRIYCFVSKVNNIGSKYNNGANFFRPISLPLPRLTSESSNQLELEPTMAHSLQIVANFATKFGFEFVCDIFGYRKHTQEDADRVAESGRCLKGLLLLLHALLPL